MYEVTNKTSRTADSLYDFHNNDSFSHPSYKNETDSFLQGVCLCRKKHLVKVFQYDFPDTASFGGNLLNEDIELTEDTKKYSMLMLLLFQPY